MSDVVSGSAGRVDVARRAEKVRASIEPPPAAERALAAELDVLASRLLVEMVADTVARTGADRTGALSRPGAADELVTILDPAGRAPQLARMAATAAVEAASGGTTDGAAGQSLGPAGMPPSTPAAIDGPRRLLEHCIRSYPSIWRGEAEPVRVLYRDRGAFLRECMSGLPEGVAAARSGLTALAGVLESERRGRSAVRVLEIGAGTGELTRRLLTCHRPSDRLTVTDNSARALRHLSGVVAGSEGVDVARLDFTEPASDQDVPGAPFDFVVGYNALHAAPDIRRALGGLRGLFAPRGLLGLVEVTDVRLWVHCVWGLAPGWWGFADDVRPASIHLTAPDWARVLRESGYAQPDAVAPWEGSDHSVVLATVT